MQVLQTYIGLQIEAWMPSVNWTPSMTWVSLS